VTVRAEKTGAVWTVIHSRPESRNAIDAETAEALTEMFLAFDSDPEAAVAVLWGEGGAFSAGWDLKDAASMVHQPRPLEELEYPLHENAVLPRGPLVPTRLELDKPVIAAIAGPAVAGGFELALWCDLRIMEESAYFGVYSRRLGVPLIDGGTVRLPRLVGTGRALDIILTGRKVPAPEAYLIGACEQVVPDGSSRVAAELLADQIARFPQAATRADRRSVHKQQGLSVRDAMRIEWHNGLPALVDEGLEGAVRFAAGEGRHGR